MTLATPTANRLADDPSALERIWFTRCPVPTASGLAYKLGWLEQEFAADGLPVSTLQEARQLGHHHYDHQLPGLFREGGNVPALAARAAGSPTAGRRRCPPRRPRPRPAGRAGCGRRPGRARSASAAPPTCAANAWRCRPGAIVGLAALPGP